MRVFLSDSTPDFALAERLYEALKAGQPGIDIYFAPRHNAGDILAASTERQRRSGLGIEAQQAAVAASPRRPDSPSSPSLSRRPPAKAPMRSSGGRSSPAAGKLETEGGPCRYGSVWRRDLL